MRTVRFLLPVLAAVAFDAGCASSATVVSSGGPTIARAQQVPYNGSQYRVAVSAFDYQAAQRRNIGQGMADMLANALINSGRFIVLEREHLDEMTHEQDLSNSNRFKKDTAAPVGQLEGAQLLVRGSVTLFEPSCKGGSLIIVSGNQACVSINIRVIDAATGRVVNATTVDGTSASNSVGLIFATGDLPIGLGAYSRTPMEQAIRNCIEAAVNHIATTKLWFEQHGIEPVGWAEMRALAGFGPALLLAACDGATVTRGAGSQSSAAGDASPAAPY